MMPALPSFQNEITLSLSLCSNYVCMFLDKPIIRLCGNFSDKESYLSKVLSRCMVSWNPPQAFSLRSLSMDTTSLLDPSAASLLPLTYLEPPTLPDPSFP
jgi:hypothetical protein